MRVFHKILMGAQLGKKIKNHSVETLLDIKELNILTHKTRKLKKLVPKLSYGTSYMKSNKEI